MEISIIGTGNMGRALAIRAIGGGHAVTLFGRDIESTKSLAEALGGNVQARAVGEALAGEIVVLAVWYPTALNDVLDHYRDQLDGRVVVDITNPIDPEAFVPLTIEAGSAAEEIAASAPGARVVKAFNTTFASTLEAGQVAGQPLDVFIASDDDAAKGMVSRLITDGGLRPIDAGPLARARELEAMGFLQMALQEPLGTGFASAIKIIS